MNSERTFYNTCKESLRILRGGERGKCRRTLLTSSIHDSKHDGRDPGHLTAVGIEDHFNFLEEHSDGLWEGVGETDRNEGSKHYGPTPATFRRGVSHRTSNCRCHGSRCLQSSLCKETGKIEWKKREKGQLLTSKSQHLQGSL